MIWSLLSLAVLHQLWLGRDCLFLPMGKTWPTIWPLSLSPYMMIKYEPVQISWYIWIARNNFRHCNLIPRFPRVSNQDSVFTLKFWPFLCYCLGVNQTTIRCLSSITNTDCFNLIDWDSVLTSKFWSPRYHFWVWLRLSLTRLLQRYQSPSRLPSKQAMYGRSFFAGLLRLRAWIWPSSGRFGSTTSTLQPIEVGIINFSPPDLVRFCA